MKTRWWKKYSRSQKVLVIAGAIILVVVILNLAGVSFYKTEQWNLNRTIGWGAEK